MIRNTIVLLKSEDGAQEYSKAIMGAGCTPFFEPVLDIQYLRADLSGVNDKTPLIFTSAHGVESLIRHYDGRSNPVYVVGDVTANAATMAGFTNVESASGTAQDLGALLVQKLGQTSLTPSFYICAEEVSFDLGDFLLKNGIQIHEIIGYRANLAEKLSIKLLHALDNREIKAVMVFSTKGAQIFSDLIEQYGRTMRLKGVMALCIAPSVIKSLSVLPFEQTLIAKTPDRDGMMDILKTISIA